MSKLPTASLPNAIQHLESNDYDSAIKSAASVLAENPSDTDAFFVLSAAMHLKNAGTQQFRNFLSHKNLAIAQLQNNPAISPGSISPEIAQFVYSFIRILRPTTLVEIGTLFGYSALCMAQAVQDNQHGHIHSFDMFLPENSQRVLSQPSQSPICGIEFVQHQLDAASLSSFVTLHQGDSSESILNLAKADSSLKVDFAFVDGSHFISGVQKDLSALDGILSENAIILLHDTNPGESGWMGPRFAAEQLASTDDYRVINMETADTLGIALLQKNGKKATNMKWRPSIKDLLLEQLLFNVHFRFKTAKK